MNILTDTLPTTVEIDGIEYPINTGFKDCLRVILAYEDVDLTPQEKQIILLSNMYPEPPHDLNKALERANWFLNGGNDNSEKDDSPRVISFSKDSNLIFAAFRQTHNIDLSNANLHWWQFMALFMDLGSETTFCQLVSLRKRVKTGKATPEELEISREIGDSFVIPEIDNRDLDEKDQEAEFLRLIEQGKSMKKGG